MNKKSGLSVLGVMFQMSLVFGATVDLSADLAGKMQEVAARRFAAAQGIELPVIKPGVQRSASGDVRRPAKPRLQRSLSEGAIRPARFEGLFSLWDFVAPAQVVQDTAFKSLKAKLDKEGSGIGANYYTVYFSVPRETILKYFFLKQLQDYFEKQNYSRKPMVGSLMTYLAQSVGGPLRVELSLENLFEPNAKKPVLMRQRVFGPSEKFNAQNWPQLKSHAQTQTLEDLAQFLNQYVAKNGYDENIVVQLFIPKESTNDLIKAKVFGRDVALEDVMDADGGYDKGVYAVLSLQSDRDYDDLKTVVVHSLKNSFNSNSDLQKQFAPIVEKVGAEMLASIKNPPAPLPRDTVASDAPAVPPAALPRDVEPPVVAPQAAKPEAPLSFLEQIRLGKELKKAETAAKPKTEEDARVRALEEALARAGVLESSGGQPGEEDGDEWDEEDMQTNIRPQQPAAPVQPQQQLPKKSVPVSPQQTKQEVKPGAADAQPRAQEDLQKDLEASLRQRRGALAEDDNTMDVDDWDDE